MLDIEYQWVGEVWVEFVTLFKGRKKQWGAGGRGLESTNSNYPLFTVKIFHGVHSVSKGIMNVHLKISNPPRKLK